MRTLLLCLALAAPVLADEVHLKNGGTVTGTVIDDGDPVVVKTVGGGTIRISRDKIESIEKKPLPAVPDPDAAPRERKPCPPVKHTDLLNGYAVKPPGGWKKIPAAKNSKATFAMPDATQFFKMDVWIVKSEATLGGFYEAFTKAYRTGFKDYESKGEKAVMLGPLAGKEFSGTFIDEKGKPLAHRHAIAADKGLFYLVFFTGMPEAFDRLQPEFDAAIASFELLGKPDLTDADMKKFLETYSTGLAAAQGGNDAEAISDFTICSELLPKHADTHLNLAILFSKSGNTKRAIEEYTTLAKLRADDPQAQLDLGTTLFKANRFPDALAAFEKALEIWPDFVDAWINLGAVKSQTAAYEDAVKAFKRAIEIDPKCVPAWFNLGNVEHARNNYKAAKDAFEAVLKLQPDHAGAKDGLRKIKQEGH